MFRTLVFKKNNYFQQGTTPHVVIFIFVLQYNDKREHERSVRAAVGASLTSLKREEQKEEHECSDEKKSPFSCPTSSGSSETR